MSPQPHRLDELLDPFRAQAPDRPAFVTESGACVTIAEFDALVARTATWLAGQGIVAGDRVAVWLVNRIEWLALLFAIARIGAILVAVNTRYRSAELRHILVSSGARMLIIQPGFHHLDFPAVIAGLDPAELQELATVAVLDEPEGECRPILGRRTIAFAPAIVPEAETNSRDTTSDPRAPFILFTTSGTTKSPKLVLHTQATIGRHALRSAPAYGFDRAGSAFLTALPFCGVFGLNPLLAAIVGAASIHIVSMFDADDATQRIARHGITHLIGSDEIFRRLVESDFERLASLRLCGFATFTPGSGAFLKETAERGLPLFGLYGSSEVNAIFAVQPQALSMDERLKGGGRPASGNDAQVRARDQETGELLGPFTPGELEIRAPTNFVGYFRNPEATREAIDAEGFFRTGDLGYVRDDGTFVYIARLGDTIRLSGFLVDPAEIEDVLKTIAGVRDAQVVGVALKGQMRPIAFVIPADPSRGIDEAAIIAAAASMLASFKVPARIMDIDAFPTTESPNGLKVQKARLRQMAAERLAAA